MQKADPGQGGYLRDPPFAVALEVETRAGAIG